MKKKIVLMMSMLALLGLLSSCSNDDENEDNVSTGGAGTTCKDYAILEKLCKIIWNFQKYCLYLHRD